MADVLTYLLLFFFQAEGGIRDLVRSRGLGDVYKRQGLDFGDLPDPINGIGTNNFRTRFADDGARHAMVPVSYTHLTLPTSDLV